MRISKMILVVLFACSATACSSTGSGFQVRTTGFPVRTAAAITQAMDAVTPTPRCNLGEVLVTERDAVVTNRSDSNGVRGSGLGGIGRTREVSERQQRNQRQFVPNETRVQATSLKWCAPQG